MKTGTDAVGRECCTGQCVTDPGSVGLQKVNGCLTVAVGHDSLGFPQVSGLWENYQCGHCIINVCIKGCVSHMGIKPATLFQSKLWATNSHLAHLTGSCPCHRLGPSQTCSNHLIQRGEEPVFGCSSLCSQTLEANISFLPQK